MKWSLIFLILVSSFQAASLEIPLKFVDANEGAYYLSGYQRPAKTFDRPPGNWKLPELVSDKPIYALVTLGDREHLIVMDKKKKRDKFTNVCYFDANANGDLTDDDALAVEHNGTSGEQYHYINFKPQEMEILVDGARQSFTLSLQASCFRSDPQKDIYSGTNWMNYHILLRSQCGYRGTAKIKGTTYRFELADANCNGRIDDFLAEKKAAPGSDRIVTTGDAIFVSPTQEKIDHTNANLLPRFLRLEDEVYDVVVDTKDSKLHLTPMEQPLMAARLGKGFERVLLFDAKSNHSLLLYQPGPSLNLPAGAYKLINYQMTRLSKSKDRWELSARGTRQGPVYTLDESQTTVLSFGEPFVPKVSISEHERKKVTGRSKTTVRLSFIATGADQEVLSNIRRIDGRSKDIDMSSDSPELPKEPTYKVLAPDGEVVTQGSFEYG